MNRIVAPIEPGNDGPDVVNLQDALRYLIENQAISIGAEEIRELLAMLEEESAAGVFKDGTLRIIQIFQKQHGVIGRGTVDEATAEMLNKLIDARGGFDQGEDRKSIVVFGRVTSSENQAMEGLTVCAYARSLSGKDKQLEGESTTDAEGNYRLMLSRDEFESLGDDPRGSALFIRAFAEDEPVGESKDVHNIGSMVRIDISVKRESDHPGDPEFQVHGAAVDEHGEPLKGVIVQAFDRDLREETLLGTARVSGGSYEIRYRRSQFQRPDKLHADLFVRVLDSRQAVLLQSDVLYRAPEVARVDLVLGGGVLQDTSKFEGISETLLPLLGDIQPQDIREDDEVQDVSFLSGDTQLSPDSIVTWMLCHRLADKTRDEGIPLNAEDISAFLSQGQPSVHYDALLEDYKYPERVALLEEKLLRGLVDLGSDRQRELLETAYSENLVPTRVRSRTEQILQSLEKYRLRFTRDTPFGAGKGTIGELLSLDPAASNSETEIISRLVEHTGSMREFWKNLETDEVLEPETVRKVQLSFEMSELTRNHIPLVEAVSTMIEKGEIKSKYDLARYTREDWKHLFAQSRPDGSPIGIPENIDGDTEEERLDHFATILDGRFERAYPTTAFSAKLGRQESSSLNAKDDVVHFLDHNPTFHLDRYRVDQYLADHPEALEGVDDKAAMIRDLKATQRVFKLSPKHKIVNALMDHGIDSAQQIYFKGPAQFAALMADSDVNPIETRKLYAKAENAYAMALNLYANNNFAMNGASPAAVPIMNLTEETQQLVSTLPNLQSLFGSLDNCECSHCQSVYSPAAHFVDILRFLGERNTQGTNAHAGKTVLQVLLERRPDLGEIELSCENTNTPLPYIDLVNELLEDLVAPPQTVELDVSIKPHLVEGKIKQQVRDELLAKNVDIRPDAHVYAPDSRNRWVIRDREHAYAIALVGGKLQLLPTRQTFLSAPELRVIPEYTNQNAYNKLAGEVFPLDLPFDLWNFQARAYLDHLGVPYPHLLELFTQQAADGTLSPSQLQIDTAALKLTETKRQILTGDLPGKKAWDFWGLAKTGNSIPNPATPTDPTTNVTGTWIEALGHVDVMLHRARISYRDLLQLLNTRYINPDDTVRIETGADSNADNCDTSTYRIVGLTEDILSRIHRFVRLWRSLDISIWELDILLNPVGNGVVVPPDQLDVSAIQRISEMSRLRGQLSIDWRAVYSLFYNLDHSVYFDHAADGAPLVQTLYQRLFRNRLVDAVAAFPEDPSTISGTIGSWIPSMLAAFRIKEEELEAILGDLGLTRNDSLDWTTLSRVYRVTTLSKALNLSIQDFRSLQRLWGQDPFSDPAATRRFADLAAEVARSSFSILEIDYLLGHRFTPATGIALDDRAIVALLQSLRDGMQKISDETRLKSEETQEDYVRSHLGRLPALSQDAEQSEALSLVDGSWKGDEAQRNTLLDRYFAGVLDPTEAHNKLAKIAENLSPAEYQDEVSARFIYVQSNLESTLARTQREAFLIQQVSDAFDIPTPTSMAVLNTLVLPGGLEHLLHILDTPRLLDVQSDGNYTFALTEAIFSRQFESLRLVHKIALLSRNMRLGPGDLSWWLYGTNAKDMEWFELSALPTDTANPIPFEQWLEARRFFTWQELLPPSDLTPLEFLDIALDSAVSDSDTIGALARLTAWSADEIATLANAFGWDVKQEFRKSANLRRLSDVMAAMRRLGVNAERAISWATAEITAEHAEELKQTIKAKYDLVQWQSMIQPLQDEFRERKRTALVSWLVSHPDSSSGQVWTDVNGLYGHLLIDVEMSACTLTSRLKQATASVQLFVQRCLLNVEDDIIAKTDLDPKWKQWKWMRYYRVWEANRKVFLYPENWIEPELRDEKSPFFRELEEELQQNDINQDTVEQAFINYLEKLDKVANLEIQATTNQVISQTESLLHVIGRTRSSEAAEHYYRTRVNGARWTAWEKVELEIAGNHLVAGIHNRRLYLLWPQFIEKADEPTTVAVPNIGTAGAPIAAPDRYWEIRMFWSELKRGKWTPKVLSNTFYTLYQSHTEGSNPQHIAFRVRNRPAIDVRVYQTRRPKQFAPQSKDAFSKIGAAIDVIEPSTTEDLIAAPNAYFHFNLQRNSGKHLYFFHNSIESTISGGETPLKESNEGAESILLLSNLIQPTNIAIDSGSVAMEPVGSFFLWDSARTYFSDYVYRRYQESYEGTMVWRTTSSFRFFIHYHPFLELFIKELNIWGIKGLLNRRIQLDPTGVPGTPTPFDFNEYKPTHRIAVPHPVEDVDFTYTGAYAPYNWELFFHIPFFIANKLSVAQRFEEALEWFHYIFDPTNSDTTVTDPDTPQQKYWITKPFYETTRAKYYEEKIQNIMAAIAKGDAELRAQVAEWRDNPFSPHLIARMRTVAYQKNVLIKYIETLIAWGDQLFRRDTIETLNEATQMYILASTILGPRPKSVPRSTPTPVMTFYQMESAGIDDFGNVLKEIENLLPNASSSSAMGDDTPELPALNLLYFGIPTNDKLLGLWDLVDDRLFKIRHCMNIEGVTRQLPLFEPPIDPAMMVRAAAAGLDLGSVLSDMSAPLPLYRFTFMIRRAQELCEEVRTLGAALLSALEAKDAEVLARLRSTHELALLDEIEKVKESAIEEALHNVASHKESRKLAEARERYYQTLIDDGLNTGELASLALTGTAMVLELAGTGLNLIGSVASLFPDAQAGAAGAGGSPTVTAVFGGKNVGAGLTIAADVVKGLATISQMGAGMSSTLAGYSRRSEEWAHQKQLAALELPMIDQQIAAAEIRQQLAERDLEAHDKRREHAEKEGDFLHSKWTNQELYDWMIAQISTVYFQSYQLAYDVAKRAERCYRYELGLGDSNFIRFGYWDSLTKGLLSGDKLSHDLKRMEMAYYEQNRREYELTKHVSLAQLDPVALLKLQQTGECLVDIPETAFDMDYPGHYFRRLKNVSLSIPSVTGPYTTIACTLTLLSNSLRKETTLLNNKYERDIANPDSRFRDEVAAVHSIATSDGQQDDGMWELHFRDERYLPFEGAGAISTWRLRLNSDVPQWDYQTISDVIIHLNYTAREGGDSLRSTVTSEFHNKLNSLALADSRQGLYRVFDLRREYPDKWYQFQHVASDTDDQLIQLDDLADRLPYFTKGYSKKVRAVEIVAKIADASNYKLMLSPLGTAESDLLPLSQSPTYGGLHSAPKDLTGNEVSMDAWTIKIKKDGAGDFQSLPPGSIEELFLVIQYTVE